MTYYILNKKTGKINTIYCEAPYRHCSNKQCPCKLDQGDNIDETNEDYLYEND
jgi:hypothetical protein